MPTWRTIIKDENYQNLSTKEKRKTKDEFFKYTISQSEKFKSLTVPDQSRIKKEFFIPKMEEAIVSMKLPRKTLGGLVEDAVQEFQEKSPFRILDKPFEQVARFVEPDTAQPGFVGAMKFIPRQIVAETIRAYKPSTAGAFGVGIKVAKPILKPVAKRVGKFAAKKVPAGFKQILLREFTVGRGQPKVYKDIARTAELERLAGGREAQEVGKVLTTKPVLGPKGKVVKKALKGEEQRYIGRIFRKEIDIGGKLPRIGEPLERTRHIAKNVEVEVGFSRKVNAIKKQLQQINSALRNKELRAQGLVGKEFRTETGFIEKVTGVTKTPSQKPLAGGKFITKSIPDIITEPIAPTTGPIPAGLFPEEEIARGISQVSKAPTINKFINLSRQNLLRQRKIVSKQLQNEIEKIEVGVRANYHLFNRAFSEQIRIHPRYKELSSIADEGRTVMDKWSKSLAESGIPKEQSRKVIEDNIGEYMARMYRSKLKPEPGGIRFFKDLRLRLNGLKHRKDLSEAVRVALREIKEPALPTAIRVKEISTSIANNKLFNTVAKNPEWTANSNVTGNLIKMPDTPSLGALRGKWVIPEIAEDVNAINMVGRQAQGLYLKALSAWKYGKVVLNPAAQTRNFLSNTILLDLSGVNHIRQGRLFPKAFSEYLSKGNIYKQALDDGAIGGEFVGTETMQKLRNIYIGTQENNLQKWLRVAGTPFRKAGEAYQGMEQISKIVKYMDVIERTGNRKLAAQEAQKWLFDYRKVPKFIDFVRKALIGAPFITFTYKALPRIAETLVNRPMTLYKYYALATAFNETARKYQGMSPVEYSRQKKLLPSWILKDIGGMPTTLLLPWKDKYGRTQWLNLEYILPVGQAPEMAERGLAGFISNPAFNITADIVKNIDFRKKAFIPPEATKKEAVAATMEHIYRQLAPNLAPGGYSYEKIRAGIVGEPEKFSPERTRELIPALLDSLVGIKINPLDVDEAEQFKIWNKKKRINELNKEFYRIINNPILKEEEKEKRIENIFDKQQKVLGE